MFRPDVEVGEALLHFSFQLLEPLNDAVHAFERVFALVLQTNVCGFSKHPDAQRNCAAVRVPNDTAGWLRQKHADSAAAQYSLPSQPR